ncbi:hypothetical protein M6D81_04480 [Paenibacillus sp. J5C_2022]|uniref:hypothetical protein n=1 Tax=Paenibacillus sp. J5C2022 TaxID=2977129 RepID=UPI0021D3505C|nr:hypothetical protein [Paenibacillus sp. J5C2022]MCU6707962.1 hypothetical protein [Paenibacillus sp. J5C2022]
MSVINLEQKQIRLKQFLQRISEDESLCQKKSIIDESRSMTELLLMSGYGPWNESIDLARLITLLLEKRGMKGCSEAMMEHILNGGTIDGFLQS